LAITLDTTESKRLEQQFLQAQKMEAVGLLAGGIAHDFNNMLNVIVGYSDLVLDRVGTQQSLTGPVEQIKKAGLRAAVLTRQLLAFSRKQVLQPRVLDLNAVVNNVSKMLLRMIGEHISLSMIAGVSLGSVQADLGQIEQILMNLVINSRDAMPQGGKIVIETANTDLDENYAKAHHPVVPGVYVMLSVRDTGCGMDEKTIARIYEPFFTTKPLGEGTGLGLSTVYGIVKQSGGHIWVYSEPGKGTTFKIYLPRVDQSAESLLRPKTETPTFEGTETVLVVEDDESLRDLTVSLLRSHGYTVLEAKDGNAGTAVAEQHQGDIHLLLTDVIMPGMSGGELARKLEALRPNLHVLFMSGYTGDLIAHQGILEPETTLLEKPFTKVTLLTKVRDALSSR
jgi:nitrogen-specific signal transduction histidine kinase/CheY-like chemotaxis protein